MILTSLLLPSDFLTDPNSKLMSEEVQMMQQVKVQCPGVQKRAEKGENGSKRASGQ